MFSEVCPAECTAAPAVTGMQIKAASCKPKPLGVHAAWDIITASVTGNRCLDIAAELSLAHPTLPGHARLAAWACMLWTQQQQGCDALCSRPTHQYVSSHVVTRSLSVGILSLQWRHASLQQVLTLVDAHIADVRVGEHDKLALVAGVCQDLLVACQAGVEHHLSNLIIRGPKGLARPH